MALAIQTRDLEMLGTPDVVLDTRPEVYRRIAWQTVPDGTGGVQFRNSFGTLALLAPFAGGELEPVADIRIRQGNPNVNEGATTDLIAGPGGGANNAYRSLLEFDVSSLAAPPAGASLVLTFDQSFGEQNSLAQTYTLHRLTSAFVESEATWNAAATSVPWSIPGGDHDPTPLGIVTLDPQSMPAGAVMTFSGAALTSAIGNALAGDGRLRLLLKSAAETNHTRSVAWLYSREDSASLRPKLRLYDLTLTQNPAQDVRLRSSEPNTNQVAAADLAVGPIQTNDVFRTLLEFDLSAAPSPLDSLAVEFTLKRDGVAGLTNLSQNFLLHLLSKPFAEASATWNSSSNNTPWSTPGGDFGPVLASTNLDPYQIVTGTKLRMDFDSAALASVNAVLQTNGMLRLLMKSDAESATVRSFIWIYSREDAGSEPRALYRAGGTTKLAAGPFSSGNPDQKFAIEDQGDGTVAIRHVASGRHLRRASGPTPVDIELKSLSTLDSFAKWKLVPANAVERYFPGTATLPNHWFRTSIGHLYESNSFPTVFHRDLGWIHLDGPGGADASFHHPLLGWLWTGPEYWPLVYSASNLNWRSIERGTNGTSLQSFDFAANTWNQLGAAPLPAVNIQALVETGDDTGLVAPSSAVPPSPTTSPPWTAGNFTPPLLVEPGKVAIHSPSVVNEWLLLFNSPGDRRHRLDASTNLVAWIPVTGDVLLPGRTHCLKITSTNTVRYFRAVDEGPAY